MHEPVTPIFVDTRAAAALLGLSTSHLEKLRFFNDPSGPPYAKIGRAVRYRTTDLAAWAEARVRGQK